MLLEEQSQEDPDDRLREAIEQTELIYKHQIDELINKNYQNINQKNQEIAELDTIAKELES